MKQVNVSNNGVVTNSAQFQTQEEADVFISYHSSQGNFGNDFSVEIIDISEQEEQLAANNQAQNFLDSTDWQILRHIRQQALGIATSLTAEEYLELEHERQMAAESIIRE